MQQKFLTLARPVLNGRADQLAELLAAPDVLAAESLPQVIDNITGWVMGILAAVAVAWVLKRAWSKRRYQPLMLELPPYRMPGVRNLALGLWERAHIFLARVGGIIFALMVVLWFLSSFPAPPAGATGPAITSQLRKQAWKSSAIMRRSFCACR